MENIYKLVVFLTAKINCNAQFILFSFSLQKTHDLSDNEASMTGAKPSTSATSAVADDSDTDTEIGKAPPAKKNKKDEEEKMDVDDEDSVIVKVPKLTRSRSKQMEKKPKCKFWDTCYRKNADHLAEFLHPHDILSEGKGPSIKYVHTEGEGGGVRANAYANL